MSNSRKIYCTISILLSLCVAGILWRYVENNYRGLFIIVVILIIRLNTFIFTPKKKDTGL